jgi:hypothetical protein
VFSFFRFVTFDQIFKKGLAEMLKKEKKAVKEGWRRGWGRESAERLWEENQLTGWGRESAERLGKRIS